MPYSKRISESFDTFGTFNTCPYGQIFERIPTTTVRLFQSLLWIFWFCEALNALASSNGITKRASSMKPSIVQDVILMPFTSNSWKSSTHRNSSLLTGVICATQLLISSLLTSVIQPSQPIYLVHDLSKPLFAIRIHLKNQPHRFGLIWVRNVGSVLPAVSQNVSTAI